MPPGNLCMDKDELSSYFDGSKTLKVFYSRTFVDYNDIENPIKSIYRG